MVRPGTFFLRIDPTFGADALFESADRLRVHLGSGNIRKTLDVNRPPEGITSMINKLESDITVIFVAHDMDLVFGVAQRIIVLHYGEIIVEGKPDEIKNNAKVREIYMGFQARAKV